MNPEVAKVLKRLHYPLDVMLTCARWYVAYPLSLRRLEQIMAERGISVDHSTVHRWALKLLPALHKAFHPRHPVGTSWRMDETCILVRGQWKYLYRAVVKTGNTSTFCCTPSVTRLRHGVFFEKAVDQDGEPDSVTIDGSLANLAAPHDFNADREIPIVIRQARYLNNIVEQDHRAIKRIV